MKLSGEKLFSKARTLHQNNQPGQAIPLYSKVLAEKEHAHALYLLGVALTQVERYDEAIQPLIRHSLLRPDHVETWVALGDASRGNGVLVDAEAHYYRALKLDPEHLGVSLGLCATYSDLDEWDKLQTFSDQVATRHPDSEEVLRYRLQPRCASREFIQGLEICVEFLILNPESKNCLAWYNELYTHLTKPSAKFISRLEQINSPQGKTLHIRALIKAREIEAAKFAFKAIRMEDPNGEVLSDQNMGLIYNKDGLPDLAEFHFWAALEKDPKNYVIVKLLIENLLDLAKKGRPEKFLEARELAHLWLKRKPNDTEALSTMGAVLLAASRPELALPYFNKLIEENPQHPMRAARLFSINYDEQRTPQQIFEDHRSWGEMYERERTPKEAVFEIPPDPDKRLRIGYVSPDFGFHPVGRFFIEVLKNHNFTDFDIHLYSNRYADEGDDAISQDFRECVGPNSWRWTRGMSEKDFLKLIKKDQIDILVELAGHTSYNRLDVLSKRAAPVQVSWLGYPNTTGLKSIDFRFSDSIVEPEGDFDQRSTELIYRLPNGFHVYRMPDYIPEVAPAPCLANGYITFGTYNNMNKIGSSSIALWAALLKLVPRSRILIKHKTLAVLDNREALKSNFAMHGIPSQRVQLKESTVGHKQHLESYRAIDIALDPLQYNGTTTTCDALAMGVPTLTLPGGMHSARVTASLLHRVGLENWVAGDREEFLEIGTRSAQNPEMLNSLRAQIREAFITSPLNDGPSMARDIESAFRVMWKWRCDQNLKRNHIKIVNSR